MFTMYSRCFQYSMYYMCFLNACILNVFYRCFRCCTCWRSCTSRSASTTWTRAFVCVCAPDCVHWHRWTARVWAPSVSECAGSFTSCTGMRRRPADSSGRCTSASSIRSGSLCSRSATSSTGLCMAHYLETALGNSLGDSLSDMLSRVLFITFLAFTFCYIFVSISNLYFVFVLPSFLNLDSIGLKPSWHKRFEILIRWIQSLPYI